MSGLAAARELRAHGCTVTVLEGRKRTGGRVWTNHDLGFPIDMGANWIQGTDGNPLTQSADHSSVQVHQTDTESVRLWGPDGELVPDDDVEEAFEEFEDLAGALEEVAYELDSDETIAEHTVAILSRMLGEQVPDPVDGIVSRWASDPFAGGSYSFIPVGASPSDFDALAAPVGERLLFAGEATIKEYYATVHGAYLSGLREARRINRLTPR